MPATTHYLPDLIALTGAAGAGKDTAANHLADHYGYTRISFAAPMRSMLQALLRHLGSPLDLQAPHEDRQAKEAAIAQLGGLLTLGGEPITPRLLGQEIGRWGRERIHPLLWVAVADTALHLGQQRGLLRFAVTDVRMPEEWAWVRRKGGAIWRLERPNTPTVRADITETALTDHADPHRPDVLLPNTGSKQDLFDRIDELLITSPRGPAR